MAALDPTAEAEADEAGNIPSTGRSTLRIVRRPIDFFNDEDSDDEEEDEDDEYLRSILAGSDDESDDEPNGGPSDPSKARRKQELRALLAAAAEAEEDEEEEDEEDEDAEMADAAAVIAAASKKSKGKAAAKASGKGKEPATKEDDEEDEDEEDDEEDSEDDEDLILEDFVVCTLDTEKTYQQPLELTIDAGETVFFTVSGSHAVHLTGNYFVEDDDEEDSDDEDDSEDDDYDLPPDIDLEELDSDEIDELDELDEIAGRIEEVDSDEEVPQLTDAKKGKGKKRPAEDAEPSLEDLIAKSGAGADAKLSKKQAKKLKNNDGDAVAAQEEKDKKRVQFAKTLEQGPTGSTVKKEAAAAKDNKAAAKGGVKVVQGVTIDDRKAGSGRVVKNGDRVGMRYIGKLENGKVFDSNKKGAPFSFRVGKGEVIRGWDIGIAGMAIGGERRLTIPASLAYGSKKLDGIPANSTLIFDVKLLEIK